MELPKERERENKKETRRFAREEHSSRDALFSLFLLSLLHIFPFESSFLLGCGWGKNKPKRTND